MTTRVTVPLLPLSPESFAPFGRILAPAGERDAGRDGYDIWIQPFLTESAPRLQIVRYHPRPFIVQRIERHLHVTESRFGIAGPAAIVVVAPPSDEPPAPDTLVAFRLDRAGILFHRGTWHAVDAYPETDEPADYLFLSEEATVGELFANPGRSPVRTQTHDFGKAGIELAIARR